MVLFMSIFASLEFEFQVALHFLFAQFLISLSGEIVLRLLHFLLPWHSITSSSSLGYKMVNQGIVDTSRRSLYTLEYTDPSLRPLPITSAVSRVAKIKGQGTKMYIVLFSRGTSGLGFDWAVKTKKLEIIPMTNGFRALI